ncbi:MAG: tRNA lysidine(34) synthetase TilS [Candidatus Marinimicrobia bacterium]|mgnify:CR=1 FL=1|jgi:tRNA(Ile)-lysidine synthase|nr:tRNA lysidine(34) synthetase TilS [Candidatus Neomarinimicrobiota bacterium]MBT3501827.1 tRNA lysidine(34) synthetase TilS [Candidatus Neomarinimicrobiota bacterium]MBT3838647.1 tRNA lysidine(34) synthetase TilS [Candidatus Neomarinimicrobiota bacterium]MBT3999739.1 tRNA lysidine(34) synthetase TilS [Candidatus Neomarinimicrobiota bacterium]MBT4578608.1 tRNA lysidine(34) synthetase TilS [Candidatus Neomarinimicrobiota bacterium]
MNELQKVDKLQIQLDSFFLSFKKELELCSDIKSGDGIIVAVSGGLDSMALLFLLNALDNFKLTIAHVNHNLRENSDKDELLVSDVCDDLNISFNAISLDPAKIKKGESIEQWGRNHRYTFFEDLSVNNNAKWIMTAHHANDQVETILMNLSRQSGVSGLRGIGKQNGKILRPLLKFSKNDLTEFVVRNKIIFHEDMTNTDVTIPRNFIRQNIVKPWQNNEPNIIKGIQGSLAHFVEWMDSLDSFIKDMLIPKVIHSDIQFDIPLKLIENMPNMTKVRLVQLLLESSEQCLWSKHQIETLKLFFEKKEIGNKHHLLNGWQLLRDRKSILGEKVMNQLKVDSVELVPDFPVEFNQYCYELVLIPKMDHDSSQNQEFVDWSYLKNQKLEIRSWLEGDTFQPLGMKGHQKISDFLINEKVDRFTKESQSVLTANGKIVWVCGRRISDSIKLTPHTTETVILNRKRII